MTKIKFNKKIKIYWCLFISKSHQTTCYSQYHTISHILVVIKKVGETQGQPVEAKVNRLPGLCVISCNNPRVQTTGSRKSLLALFLPLKNLFMFGCLAMCPTTPTDILSLLRFLDSKILFSLFNLLPF